MKTRKHALIWSILVVLLFGTSFASYAEEEKDRGNLTAEYHTQDEIRQFWKDQGIRTGESSDDYARMISEGYTSYCDYVEKPSYTEPCSPGVLQSYVNQEAIDVLNMYRYVAGVPYEVELDSTCANNAQAATFVNAMSDTTAHISHYPARGTELMAKKYDDLFKQGYDASAKANLAWSNGGGVANIPQAISGWVTDSDSYNKSVVGHRRWVLAPSMEKTGFGWSKDGKEDTYAMYTGFTEKSQLTVAWPAQNTPMEMFMSGTIFDEYKRVPWSLSLGKKIKSPSTVRVKVKNNDTGEYNVYSSKGCSDSGEFYVDNGYYGQQGCVIWIPKATVNNGESFHVNVYVDGENYDYDVNFFEIIKTSSAPVTGEAAVKAFVNRLYTIVLDRKADPAGLKDWTKQLVDKEKTGSEVAAGFFMSQEMTERNLSDEDYVKICYRTMLDREADESGLADWVSRLENGISREAVLYGFTNSAEFDNICNQYEIERGTMSSKQVRDQNVGITSFVARCYTKALGRKYDVDGLNYWSGKILSTDNKKQVAEEVASDGFFHSLEFANKGTTNGEYVAILYRTFLGREYDEAGYKDWVGQLDDGKSRDEVLYGFSRSSEFNDIMTSYGL